MRLAYTGRRDGSGKLLTRMCRPARVCENEWDARAEEYRFYGWWLSGHVLGWYYSLTIITPAAIWRRIRGTT
jgi:hypothetical protein